MVTNKFRQEDVRFTFSLAVCFFTHPCLTLAFLHYSSRRCLGVISCHFSLHLLTYSLVPLPHCQHIITLLPLPLLLCCCHTVRPSSPPSAPSFVGSSAFIFSLTQSKYVVSQYHHSLHYGGLFFAAALSNVLRTSKRNHTFEPKHQRSSSVKSHFTIYIFCNKQIPRSLSPPGCVLRTYKGKHSRRVQVSLPCHRELYLNCLLNCRTAPRTSYSEGTFPYLRLIIKAACGYR